MSRLSPPPVVQQPPERMLTPRRSPRRPPTAMGPALQSHGSMVSSESPAVGTPVVGTRQSTSAFAASETLAMPQPPSRTGTIRSSPCVGQSAPRHSLEEDEEQQPPTDDSQGTANRQGSRHAPGLKRTSLTVEQQVKIIKRHESSGIDNKLTYAQLQAWAKEEFHLDAPPSRSLVAKTLKNKEFIIARAANEIQLGRKRKRTTSAMQAELESSLLQWVHDHDSTHGGRVPITDHMLVEQVNLCNNNPLCNTLNVLCCTV